MRSCPYSAAARHTFAFFSVKAGVDIRDLSREVGHSNISMTADTYGHWSRDMGSRAASLREAP